MHCASDDGPVLAGGPPALPGTAELNIAPQEAFVHRASEELAQWDVECLTAASGWYSISSMSPFQTICLLEPRLFIRVLGSLRREEVSEARQEIWKLQGKGAWEAWLQDHRNWEGTSG